MPSPDATARTRAACALVALLVAAGCGGETHVDTTDVDAGPTMNELDAGDVTGGAAGMGSRDADGGGLVVVPLQPSADADTPDAATAEDAASVADAMTEADAATDRADGGDARDVGGAAALDASTDAGPVLEVDDLPYAGEVVSFTEGSGAGFGSDAYPDVVLGPPMGAGTGGGSLDVLSLGVGGELVMGFGELDVIDEPGPDFIVFENPFWPGGDPTRVFAELGEVAVSEDGVVWHTFSCDTAGDGQGHFPGCAGWTPTLAFDPLDAYPLDPAVTGGDAFDLEDLGVGRARYVRITDLGTVAGGGGTAGFDLDAIGLIHFEPAR